MPLLDKAIAMFTQLKTLQFGPHSLILSIESNSPFIECEGEIYKKLPDLVTKFQELELEKYRKTLCEVINYLAHGVKYDVIEHAEAYRKRYCKRIAQEEKLEDPLIPRVSDYGEFDVDQVTEPRIQGRTLIFYVEQHVTGLPYSVEIPFPIPQKGYYTTYHVLPHMVGV